MEGSEGSQGHFQAERVLQDNLSLLTFDISAAVTSVVTVFAHVGGCRKGGQAALCPVLPVPAIQ